MSSSASADVKNGSQLFVQRCSGCHTLGVVGAEGSASKVRDRERVDGPNFDVRKECVDNVLYAIRNGGYSGAIMPENLVVGKGAEDVAKFLQTYSGLETKATAGAKTLTCPGE
jgi:mono/diheme cytochrome c family protein